MKLFALYNSHYTGSSCWSFNSERFNQMVNSFNVNVKVICGLPYSCHSWLVEELCGHRHARQLIYCRFIKFVNSLVDHKKDCIRSLFNMVVGDVRSLSGGNLRRVILDTGVLASPGKTSHSDLHNYKVYPVPAGHEWKIGVLRSLLEIRSENWEILFDDEDDHEMMENDIVMMIDDVCTN